MAAAERLTGVSGCAAWCALNFWRCRHAHCLVSGAGWLALAGFSFVEAGLGRSMIHGDEQLVFLAVLVAALIFEGAWCLARGTNAIAGAACQGDCTHGAGSTAG